jgi:hypothetical protein
VKVLVPFSRDRDTLLAGSYFSTYCPVPASPCPTVISSRLVLTAARSSVWYCGNFFTHPRLQNHNTLTSVRSIYYFLLHVSINRMTIIREIKWKYKKYIFLLLYFLCYLWKISQPLQLRSIWTSGTRFVLGLVTALCFFVVFVRLSWRNSFSY